MFPSQTSLIPATVSLLRFFERNGFGSFSQNYPYWYLGSTPYKYLIGPVFPSISYLLKFLLPSVSLFDITIYIIVLSFLLSSVFWGLLASSISENKVVGYVTSLLLFLLPWKFLSGLATGEATDSIAKNLVPFSLLSVWWFLIKRDRKSAGISILITSFLLLINTSIITQLSVGLVGISFAVSFRGGKVKEFLTNLKKTFIIFISALILVTFWYGPGYWWTILFNPSIGGASGGKVILRIFDLARGFAPVILALISVYFGGRVKTKLGIFTAFWLGTFVFLSVFRFMGDPKFWMDWTAWVGEIEIGISMTAALFLISIHKNSEENPFRRTLGKKLAFSIFLILCPYVMFFYVYGILGNPKLLSIEIPEGVRSLRKLSEVAGGKTVFLSGATVFWADSLYDIYQVRGGRDQVSRHPTWAKAAYELREGYDPSLSKGWIENLKIKYVLVHTGSSSEYYHDFKNIRKWDKIGERVTSFDGDIIFRVGAKP